MPRATTKTRRSPASLGTIRRTDSGRFQAFYRLQGQTFRAPQPFESREAAQAWLAAERSDRALGTWRDPRLGQVTLAEYSRAWLEGRANLAPRTRDLYRRLLDSRILVPAGTAEAGRLDLSELPLAQLTPALIRSWFGRMSADCATDALERRKPQQWQQGGKRGEHPARAWGRANGFTVARQGRLSPELLTAWNDAGQLSEPTARPSRAQPGRTTAAQTYRLLHTILAAAVADGLLTGNPANLVGAGTVHHPERTTATPAEVDALAAAMPERLSAAVMLAAWSGLRQGELLALARRHVDTDTGSVRVERSLGRDGEFHLTKTRASVRTVYLPRFVVDQLAAHLHAHTGPEPDALVFTSSTGKRLRAQRLLAHFTHARTVVGRPELSWHDLRHTGATLAYSAGGSVRDVQRRLGHATARAAMIYAHAADDSDKHLAARLDATYGTLSAPADPEPTPHLPSAPAAAEALPQPDPEAPDAGTPEVPDVDVPDVVTVDVPEVAPVDVPAPTPLRRATPTRRRHLYAVPDLPTTAERIA